MTLRKKVVLIVTGVLALYEGLSLIFAGITISQRTQMLFFDYAEQIAMMTEGSISPKVARMLADGQNWIILGWLIAAIGLGQLSIGLYAAIASPKKS